MAKEKKVDLIEIISWLGLMVSLLVIAVSIGYIIWLNCQSTVTVSNAWNLLNNHRMGQRLLYSYVVVVLMALCSLAVPLGIVLWIQADQKQDALIDRSVTIFALAVLVAFFAVTSPSPIIHGCLLQGTNDRQTCYLKDKYLTENKVLIASENFRQTRYLKDKYMTENKVLITSENFSQTADSTVVVNGRSYQGPDKKSLVTRLTKKNRVARVTVYGQEMKPGLNPVVKEAISHMTSSDGNVKSVKINKIVINK